MHRIVATHPVARQGRLLLLWPDLCSLAPPFSLHSYLYGVLPVVLGEGNQVGPEPEQEEQSSAPRFAGEEEMVSGPYVSIPIPGNMNV